MLFLPKERIEYPLCEISSMKPAISKIYRNLAAKQNGESDKK
jgi:hypothetical protein